MNAIKRYVNAVDRRLHLPLAVRARVMSDFATTIQSLREEGLDDEAIMKKLGEPRCAAARLRAELGEYAAPQKSPLRWLFLALAAALAALWALGLLVPAANGAWASSVGVIGGADGPTAIWVASSGAAGFFDRAAFPGALSGAVLPAQALAFLCAYWMAARTKGVRRVIAAAAAGLLLEALAAALFCANGGVLWPAAVQSPASTALGALAFALLPGGWLNAAALVWALRRRKGRGDER